MALRPSAHSQFTAYRAAARASHALMRATIADIEEIIRHSRNVIDDSREAMRRVEDLLQTKSLNLSPEFPSHLRPKLIGELLDFRLRVDSAFRCAEVALLEFPLLVPDGLRRGVWLRYWVPANVPETEELLNDTRRVDFLRQC